MRWGHHISPVMMAPLRSAARCLIALLALGSPSWAREPGKSDPKATGTKPDNAKPDTAKESIEWKPDKKLDWDKFKGGKPKKADHDAETYAFIQRSWECKVNGEYSYDAHAEFIPEYSTVDPGKKSAALLAHEQIHFDIWQKHAAEFHKKLGEILKEKCKCNRSVADEKAMKEAISAAWRAATQAADAENKKYDDETNHGQKDKEQQEWAEKIAKDLGQPAPKAPPAPKDGGDGGLDETPKAEKPAACKDCEAAEAERKKKLAELEEKLKPIKAEADRLFKQIDAIDTDINAVNIDSDKAKEALKNAK